MIFGALVARTIHLRRRRNAAYLAAIAAGTYVTPPHNGKRRYDPLLPKPALWEVHTTPHDPEKGWAEMLVRCTLHPHTPMGPESCDSPWQAPHSFPLRDRQLRLYGVPHGTCDAYRAMVEDTSSLHLLLHPTFPRGLLSRPLPRP